MSHERKLIPLNSLLLDQENARHGLRSDQNAVLLWMSTKVSRSKIFRLAESIAQRGISPAELPVVVPAPDNPSLYVVLEGNRRVAVLKLLADPQKCPDENARRRFQKLKEKMSTPVPSHVECVVFQTLGEAAPWIELRHTGQHQGAGIVTWGPREIEAFNKRIGRPVKYPLSTGLLEYARANGLISEEDWADFRTTNLDRILVTRDARRVLGLDVQQGVLIRVASQDYVDTAVRDTLEALASPKVTVSQLIAADQRVSFVRKLRDDNRWGRYEVRDPAPLAARGQAEAQAGTTQDTGHPDAGASHRDPRDPLRRKNVIRRGTAPPPDRNGKLTSTFLELRNLDVDRFPIAGAVLVRMYIELAVNLYLQSNQLSLEGKLHQKTKKVREHILQANPDRESQLKITNDLKGLETFSGDADSLGSVNTFNALVHFTDFVLNPSELKRTWDRLEPCRRWLEQ